MADKEGAKLTKANVLAIPDNLQKKELDQQSSQASQSGKKTKRRGKKRERDDVYFVKGNKKIEDIQRRLKDESGTMSLEERQKLRNQISA